MDMNNENWNETPPLPDMEAELKKIRKDIRRRNRKIVLTSLVLAAAIFIGAVKIAVPALEKTYWDPNTSTYIEDVPDLEIAMDVYTELFCPGYKIESFAINKTDFASYSIQVGFEKIEDFDVAARYVLDSYRSAAVQKGEFSIPSNFWEYNLFENSDIAVSLSDHSPEEESRAILEQLPDYMHVLAAVCFPEPLNMNEVSQLVTQLSHGSALNYCDTNFIWLAIRDGNSEITCGFNPQRNIHGKYFEFVHKDTSALKDTAILQQPIFDMDSDYPHLSLGLTSATGRAYELHVTSMLQFSQDQLEKNTGIVPGIEPDPDYYKNTLAYLEANGIKSTGGYLIITPQALIQLYEEGTISKFTVCDAWVGFPGNSRFSFN